LLRFVCFVITAYEISHDVGAAQCNDPTID